MGEELHERQNKAIRDIENRLTRIEVLLETRDKKSDEMLNLVHAISEKMSGLPTMFVTLREFEEYKAGVKSTSSASSDGIKTWQAVVFSLILIGVNAMVAIAVARL